MPRVELSPETFEFINNTLCSTETVFQTDGLPNPAATCHLSAALIAFWTIPSVQIIMSGSLRNIDTNTTPADVESYVAMLAALKILTMTMGVEAIGIEVTWPADPAGHTTTKPGATGETKTPAKTGTSPTMWLLSLMSKASEPNSAWDPIDYRRQADANETFFRICGLTRIDATLADDAVLTDYQECTKCGKTYEKPSVGEYVVLNSTREADTKHAGYKAPTLTTQMIVTRISEADSRDPIMVNGKTCQPNGTERCALKVHSAFTEPPHNLVVITSGSIFDHKRQSTSYYQRTHRSVVASTSITANVPNSNSHFKFDLVSVIMHRKTKGRNSGHYVAARLRHGMLQKIDDNHQHELLGMSDPAARECLRPCTLAVYQYIDTFPGRPTQAESFHCRRHEQVCFKFEI
jgi:hypothetical protein